MYAIVGVCGVGAVLCLQIIAELEKRVASLQNLVQELRARLMGAGGDVSGCVGLDSMAVVSEDTVAIGSVRVDTNDGDSDGDGGVATGKEDEEDDDNPVREHTTHGETRVWPDGVRFGVVWVVVGSWCQRCLPFGKMCGTVCESVCACSCRLSETMVSKSLLLASEDRVAMLLNTVAGLEQRVFVLETERTSMDTANSELQGELEVSGTAIGVGISDIWNCVSANCKATYCIGAVEPFFCFLSTTSLSNSDGAGSVPSVH